MRRYDWIDIAKGVGILLIVYGHVQGEWSIFQNFAASFCVIIFLILSGWLFSTKKTAKRDLKATAKKILKPYLVFSVIAVVVKLVYDLCTGAPAFTNALWDIYKTACGYGIGAIWYLSSYLIACVVFFKALRMRAKKLLRKALPMSPSSSTGRRIPITPASTWRWTGAIMRKWV